MKVGGYFNGLNVTPSEYGNTGNLIDRMLPGDVLKARIVEMTGNQALLRLTDGTAVSAALSQPVNMKQGELVDFLVTGRKGESVVLQILKNTSGEAGIISTLAEKELSAAGLEVSDSALDIASALIKSDNAISRELIARITGGLEANKELDIDEAVFLAASGLDINEENTAAIIQLGRNRVKLAESLIDLSRLLLEADFGSEVNPGKPVQTGSGVFSQVGVQENLKETLEQGLLSIQHKVLLEEGILDRFENTISGKADNQPSSVHLTGRPEVLQADQALTADQALLSEKNSRLPSNNGMIDRAQTETGSIVSNGEAGVNDTVNASAAERLIQATAGRSQGSILTDNIDKFLSLLNFIKSLSGNATQNGTDLTLQSNVTAAAGNQDGSPDEIPSGVNSNNSEKSLEEVFLKLEKELDGEAVKNSYKSILEKLSISRQLLERTGYGNNEAIFTRLDNLENNIRFINELNNYNAYVQIPLNLQGQKTTAELYVLRRNGRSRGIDPDNATLYISLDTLHMGQVDSLIKVNRKTISVNLRTQESETVSFFKENGNRLYNAMTEKGYKLIEYRCTLVEKPAGIIEAASILGREPGRKRTVIDYRL